MEIAVLLLVVKDLPGVAGWKRLEIVHTARRKPPQQIKGNFKWKAESKEGHLWVRKGIQGRDDERLCELEVHHTVQTKTTGEEDTSFTKNVIQNGQRTQLK